MVYLTKEEGEWRMLLPGPHFGKQDPALQGECHEVRGRILYGEIEMLNKEG